MDLEIVLSLKNRLNRIKKLERTRSNYESNLLGHVLGLEQFFGKNILEIGGTNLNNLANYFIGIGADYEQVRLEPNDTNQHYIKQINFMDLNPENLYDLIISIGVFEKGAIDKALDEKLRNKFVKPEITNKDRLKKLCELTKEGGYNIIGTISDPCMFNDEEIAQSGFQKKYRSSPFYLVGINTPESSIADVNLKIENESELLIIQK